MPKRYWSIILIYLAAQFSALIGVPLLLQIFNNMTLVDAQVYWSIFSMAIATYFIIKNLRPDIKNAQMRERPGGGGTVLKWSVIGFVLAYLAQVVANYINIEVFGITQSSENTNQLISMIEDNLLFIVLPILFAPLLEEIIFRKIIFGQLHQRMNFFIAAIISALMFSLLHFDFKFILTYAAMGLVFAYLYVKTKRIIVPIIVHMALNTFAVMMNLFIDIEELERQLEELENAAMILIGG
ncbi:CPBP family intramembrane glutamic endopeptidase [Tenuibacillus multivorans]|uniref:CAAX prenyl protease 2/Lysostaphin resistance protein A-like domain-containing protein n=1 Tax=Tenuibacillus multivorans TaxID=237069 RepID=A0A1H0E3U7_9BACI|nr:type II CAAX endopeptidase family protein [Tenuibacillus multivorans]GEL76660.1 peptidase [Tenuibacillus multivorans]SDN77147.1 hypothetical protein SAMN05216498_3057 [Tenuibacillus multivorans]